MNNQWLIVHVSKDQLRHPTNIFNLSYEYIQLQTYGHLVILMIPKCFCMCSSPCYQQVKGQTVKQEVKEA